MLKENQFVTVKWNPYSQKYYQSKVQNVAMNFKLK